MHTNRLYLVDITDPSNPIQTEVTRSAPNQLQPTTEWEVPVDFTVCKVRVCQGYGNIDAFIYAVREPEIESSLAEVLPEMKPVQPAPKVAAHNAKVQSL